MNKGIFITATDTGVGKTIVSFVLGTLLQEKGVDVGVMKPVQCAGNDAQFLRKSLRIKDPLSEINPYRAWESLSPHVAFKRAKIKVEVDQITEVFRRLQQNHDFLIVEGAGGLLVPIKENYLVCDLIRDLGLDALIVSRSGLGTINHTLLTVQEAQRRGINARGIIFNQAGLSKPGIPEKTNPKIIEKLTGVPVLGCIPHLEKIDRKTIVRECSSKINLKILLKDAINSRNSVNPKTRQFIRWDKKYVWHPFTQMRDWLDEEPLVIEEGKGCYLKDTQGRWYLDGVSSLWVNVHGHQHPKIDAALEAQMRKISHSTFLGLSNEPAVKLAKRLIEIVPKGLTKVFYSDNGSTAVEIALKMSYQYWQNTGKEKKNKIIYFENSYHGDTLGSVSVGGIDLFHKVYKGLIFEAIKIKAPHLENLKSFLKENHGSVCSVVIEPLIQGAAGMLLWPEDMLKEIRWLCTRYDVFLIADEVATGFGRTGKMFACQHEGVTPDFMCLAKGLTAGYLPLAATLVTECVFKGFLFDYKDQKTFFHGHTYTANPLACAAALANLDIFKQESVLKKLQPKIKFLSQELKKFYNLSHVGEVRKKGFMVGIEIVRDRKSGESYPWQEKTGVRVCQEARRRGIILRPLGNVIVLLPPLAISTAELKILLEGTYRAIKTVTETL